MALEIRVIPGQFSVCQVKELACDVLAAPFCFVGKTDEELSLVCPIDAVPEKTLLRDDGWRMFGIVGMILSVPVFAIIYTVLTILLRNRLRSKGFTNNTAYYVNLYGFDEDGNPIRGERVKKKEEKKYHYMLGFLNKRKKKKDPEPDEEDRNAGVFEYRPIEDDYTVIEEDTSGQEKKAARKTTKKTDGAAAKKTAAKDKPADGEKAKKEE